MSTPDPRYLDAFASPSPAGTRKVTVRPPTAPQPAEPAPAPGPKTAPPAAQGLPILVPAPFPGAAQQSAPKPAAPPRPATPPAAAEPAADGAEPAVAAPVVRQPVRRQPTASDLTPPPLTPAPAKRFSLAPKTAGANPGRRRRGNIVVAGIAVAVLGGGVGAWSTLTGPDTPPPAPAAKSSTPAESVGVAIAGNGAGSHDSGADAILGFDYGYYVQRSGESARSFYDPRNTKWSAAVIQDAIDTGTAPGTTHDLTIIPTKVGSKYDVSLTVTVPDGDTVTHQQVFTTEEIDGKFYVVDFYTVCATPTDPKAKCTT